MSWIKEPSRIISFKVWPAVSYTCGCSFGKKGFRPVNLQEGKGIVTDDFPCFRAAVYVIGESRNGRGKIFSGADSPEWSDDTHVSLLSKRADAFSPHPDACVFNIINRDILT